MNEKPVLREKKEGLLRRKVLLALLLDLLLAFLGVTSLYEKIVLLDGVLAFRAFTVDGNLFTTLVCVIAVFSDLWALIKGRENEDRLLFFLSLCAAVTEAVIFIVVMIGYLPFVPDTPEVTPYHMFCLHVAIPLLAVARFILFARPQGILKPSKLLYGSLPIGVYGAGIVTAIKLGVLATSYVPYSFLDFEHNFIWYFLFALFAIPGFGYLWAWVFYRLNTNAGALWYKEEDIHRLKDSRVDAMSRFDVVDSGIAIVFSLLSVLLLSFSLMTNSRSSAAVQQEMMANVTYLMLDDYDRYLGDGVWHMENGALYKGDTFVSDGTEDGDYFIDDAMLFHMTLYVKAEELLPEVAAQYEPGDYVSMLFLDGEGSGPDTPRGRVLDPKIPREMEQKETETWYEQIKLERALTEEEEKHRDQLRNTKESFFHFCMTFGATMSENGIGIVEVYIPAAFLMEQIKKAEFSSDFVMAFVIVAVFGFLFLITRQWIRVLERSVEFLKQLARDEIPEQPLDLGHSTRISGLTKDLNAIREEKLNREKKE